VATSPRNHIMGMASSSLQRGGSAFLMFHLQGHAYQWTCGISPKAGSPRIANTVDHTIAGALSGALSAPFHTVWELIKVRGTWHASSQNRDSKSILRLLLPPDHAFQMYRSCLLPMICRHAIFDATFFGVNASLSQSSFSSAQRFALGAASASFTNLLWDVWKTRKMEAYPKNIRFIEVARSFRLRTFFAHYLVKGTDLTANWFAVGYVKDRMYV